MKQFNLHLARSAMVPNQALPIRSESFVLISLAITKFKSTKFNLKEKRIEHMIKAYDKYFDFIMDPTRRVPGSSNENVSPIILKINACCNVHIYGP